MPPEVTFHVVVCGLGHVGFRVAELFRRRGASVSAVVVHGARWRSEAARSGIGVVIGDARDTERLEEAGLPRATAIVAATDSDLVNVEVALDARRVRDDIPIVVRVFDPNLGRSMEKALGGPVRAFSASALAGPRLAWAALGEPVVAGIDYSGVEALVARIPVDAELAALARKGPEAFFQGSGLVLLAPVDASEGAPPFAEVLATVERYVAYRRDALRLPGRPIREGLARTLLRAWKGAPRPLRRASIGVGVVMALSVVVFGLSLHLSPIDALYFVLTTATTTGYGDITPKDSGGMVKLYACALMITGALAMAILTSLVTDFVVGERAGGGARRAEAFEDHVIVVGLGRAGFRTVEEFVRIGVPVVAIDLRTDGPFVSALGRDSPVVFGDGRLAPTLRAAGVTRARAIVAATGDDAVNLAIVLAARQWAPRIRTVARLFDASLAQKLQASGLVDEALSTSRIAAASFVAAATAPGSRAAWLEEDALVTLAPSATEDDRPVAHFDKGSVSPVSVASAGEHVGALCRRRWPLRRV